MTDLAGVASANTPTDPADEAKFPAEAPPGSWRSLVPAVLVVVLLAATALGAVALQRHDDSTTSAAPQIGWMGQGCAQWAASTTAGGNPVRTEWCTSMTSWMSDQMGRGQMGQGQMGQGPMGQGPMGQGQMGQGQMGQGPMGQGQMGQGPMGQGPMSGAAMWQSPESMQATCQQWASSGNAPAGMDAPANCAQMVAWMTQHMGDWNGWMTNGPMMMPSTTN